MTRVVWLAAGLVLILGGGLGLLYGLPNGTGPDQTSNAMREEQVILPSGLETRFHEMLWNEPGDGLTYRFRFVAPAFRQTEDVEAVMADLQYLCTDYALPKLATTGPQPKQVIISLADAPSEFGTFDPDITQVFEAFDVSSGSCMWEEF